MFNAADLYISPYLAEGFNLTVLESLCAGLPVLVPETGSTHEYINDIASNGGEKYIYKLKSQVGAYSNGMHQNIINAQDLTNLLKDNLDTLESMKEERYKLYATLQSFIQDNYSWDSVSSLLYDYFGTIVNNSK